MNTINKGSTTLKKANLYDPSLKGDTIAEETKIDLENPRLENTDGKENGRVIVNPILLDGEAGLEETKINVEEEMAAAKELRRESDESVTNTDDPAKDGKNDHQGDKV